MRSRSLRRNPSLSSSVMQLQIRRLTRFFRSCMPSDRMSTSSTTRPPPPGAAMRMPFRCGRPSEVGGRGRQGLKNAAEGGGLGRSAGRTRSGGCGRQGRRPRREGMAAAPPKFGGRNRSCARGWQRRRASPAGEAASAPPELGGRRRSCARGWQWRRRVSPAGG